MFDCLAKETQFAARDKHLNHTPNGYLKGSKDNKQVKG
jgi:hypothetical protein